MMHSAGCRMVLQECDFPEDEYRKIEIALCSYSPKHIIKQVWKYDPNGENDSFDPSYLRWKSKERIEVGMDDSFWETYDYIAQFLDDDFSAFDFPLIGEMSGDMERLRYAISRSKPNIKYIHKVWGDRPDPPKVNKLDFNLEDHGVKIRDVN